jgi:hypothetical protein
MLAAKGAVALVGPMRLSIPVNPASRPPNRMLNRKCAETQLASYRDCGILPQLRTQYPPRTLRSKSKLLVHYLPHSGRLGCALWIAPPPHLETSLHQLARNPSSRECWIYGAHIEYKDSRRLRLCLFPGVGDTAFP